MDERSLSSEEEIVAVDPKFQRFGASLERALRTFEITREWHDLISALTRLHKVSHLVFVYNIPFTSFLSRFY